MPTAQKQTKKINLLPQEEFASSTLGRILTWLLSTFRIIVILTELVVMGAFLSRFWLDAKANDLNELINQKQAIISASKDFEKEFKKTQKRLTTFSSYTSEKDLVSKYLDTISSYLPPEVTLSSIQLIENAIQIRGTSASEMSIAQLLSNLKNDPVFSKITLMGTSTNPQNKSLLVFNLKIDLTKGETE